MKKKLIFKALFVVSLSLFIVSSSIEAKVPDSVLKQKKAVVTIYINDSESKQIATGSGFIINSTGIIVTNYHVVSKGVETTGNTILVKLENGSFFPVEEILSLDIENDVAFLKVNGKELPFIKLGAFKPKQKQGDKIIVIGSPMGLETSVSDGIISSIRGQDGLIQITAPISPGSSGSPVFNLKGEVIGIATFLIEGGQNLNFAIPAKYILKILTEHLSDKQVQKIERTTKKETISATPMSDIDKSEASEKIEVDPADLLISEILSDIQSLRHKEAILKLIRFKNNFSNHVAIAGVHYLLGDLYIQEEEHQKAIDELEYFVNNYPTHPKVTNAYLLIGISYQFLGKELLGLKQLRILINNYPNSQETVNAKNYISKQRWFLVGTFKNENTTVFLDGSTITLVDNNIYRIFTKFIEGNGVFFISNILIDCKLRRFLLVSKIDYNSNGQKIDENDFAKITEWRSIYPENYLEIVIKSICEN